MTSSEQTAAHVQAAADGEALWFTTNRITIKARAEDTGGAFGLIEAQAPPGASPPLHVHHREDETFWVLEGEVSVRCGEDTFRLGAGDFAFLPRGVAHTFVVEGEAPARFVNVITPGGFEGFFADAGRPAEGPGLPPAGPPDVELLARVSAAYDSELVGPPMAAGG